MDMPVIVEIVGIGNPKVFDKLFDYFHYVDNTFSTFKKTSEITKINNGLQNASHYSRDMREILHLAANTKKETNGYFDIHHAGNLDPSGIVKGWAIHNAGKLLAQMGFKNYYVEAGGDIEVAGANKDGKPWTIGIRNPFRVRQIIKVIRVTGKGIATSGTYARGNHVYNPKNNTPVADIVSLTVIGPNIYEADRFATAAFAMGKAGIHFIERLRGFEGYLIDTRGVATLTSGFEKYLV